MNVTRLFALACVLALATTAAQAQDEMPAIGGVPEPQQTPPKPQTKTAKPATPLAKPGPGTTIVGERESPIGLYIMPWRDARPEADMDRPARLLHEKLEPIDEDSFVRQVEYYNALNNALEAKGLVTPGGR